MVQGVPSTSSYVMINGNGSDWLRKLSIACLVCASAANGSIQNALQLIGVGVACITLLANLGSRAWHFLHWRPISFGGPFAPLFAFVASLLAGICFPHLGQRKVESGGKVATESVMNNAFWVALVFLASDLADVRELLLGGLEVRCMTEVEPLSAVVAALTWMVSSGM